MKIKLNTINDVHDFVLICNKYQEIEIYVKQDKQIIDGRSILGIFSLNLVEPLNVTIDTSEKIPQKNFYLDIKKWEELY